MPIIRPRRATNQRVATIAASTLATKPMPEPTNTPHSTMSCQDCVISGSSATPVPMMHSAPTMVPRTPKRSIVAAENGAISPYRPMQTPTASEMVARLQPNSVSNGTTNTPGTARIPAPISSTMKVTPATTKP